MKGWPKKAEVEAALTMAPPLRSRSGKASRQHRKVLVRLLVITWLKASSEVSTVWVVRRMPAMLIKASSRPSCPTKSANRALTAASSETDMVLARAIPPKAAAWSARAMVSFSPALLRSAPRTFAPSATNRSTTARPMPDPAPVTITRLPSNLDP
jgi:hypothetical protein